MTTTKHGHRTTYVKGCRCDDCREANRIYAFRNVKHHLKVSYGLAEPKLVSASRARVHVFYLQHNGMGYRAIADAAGVSPTLIARLIGYNSTRPSNNIRPENERKILSVRLDAHRVDSTISKRKIQALVAIGYSMNHLARMIGIGRSTMATMMNTDNDVNRSTAKKIDKIYRELHITPGSNVRAKNHAKKRNWLPPLAWDDINNIAEQPRQEHIRSDKRSRLLPHVDDLLELISHGETIEAIATRFGVRINTVEQAISRHRQQHAIA